MPAHPEESRMGSGQRLQPEGRSDAGTHFYLDDEDYRWAVLRAKVPTWLFQVINLTFISATQNVLLLILAFPAKVASTKQPHTPLATSDYLLAALALVDQAIEFTADNQQWAFHQYKHAYLAAQKGGERSAEKVVPYDKKMQWPGAGLNFVPQDAKRGFITRGLWAYSRHPNFFCEQSFWWIITLIPLLSPSPPHLPFSTFPSPLIPPLSITFNNFHTAFLPLISALSTPLAHTAPALALSLLFFSSTLFTESISKSKYPREYAAYQERVVDSIVWGAGAKEE
ncbi:hypothetical protein H0H87_001754 [Tephrocybe sp. NHM501043]|nr:hypothetical protein H0H87_001754 [Tephrocybe sp. NHM501043]